MLRKLTHSTHLCMPSARSRSLMKQKKKLLGRVEHIQLNEMRARLSALFARWRDVMRKLLFQRKRERERENGTQDGWTLRLHVSLACLECTWSAPQPAGSSFEFRKDPLNVDWNLVGSLFSQCLLSRKDRERAWRSSLEFSFLPPSQIVEKKNQWASRK